MANNLDINIQTNKSEFKRDFSTLSKSMQTAAKQAETLQKKIKPIDKEIKKADSMVKRFGRSAKKAFGNAGKFGQKMLKGLKIGALGAAAALTGVGFAVNDIAKTASKYQSTKNLFVGPDEEKTFERILDTATKTGVTTRDVARQQASILQRTLKDAEATEKVFGLIQDVKFGSDLDDSKATQLTESIAKLGTKAKISATDLEQIDEIAGSQLAKTFKDVEKIELPDVLSSLKDQFSDGVVGASAVVAAGQDIDSQLARIGSTVDKLKVDLFTEFFGDPKEASENLKGAIDTVQNALMSLKDVIKGTVNTIKTIVNWFEKHENATTILASVIGVGLVAALYAAATAAWAAVAPMLVAAAPFIAVGLAIGALIVAVKALIENWDEISSFVVEATGKMYDKVVEKFGDLVSWFKSLPELLWDSLKSGFDLLISQFKEMGSFLIEGFVKGITGSMSLATDAISSLGESTLSGLKGILGIQSPSKEMEKLGKFSAEGFNKGLSDKTMAMMNKDVVKKMKQQITVENGAPTGVSAASSTTNSDYSSYVYNTNNTNKTENRNMQPLTIHVDARNSKSTSTEIAKAVKESLGPILYDFAALQKNKAAGQRG